MKKKTARVSTLPANAVEVHTDLFVTPNGIVYGHHKFTNKGSLYTKYSQGQGSQSKGGYPYVHKQGKNYTVHRLIAQAFIPNPEDKPHVNHIDGVKQHNHVDNLEWVTNSENMIHAKASGIQIGRADRPVTQMDMFGTVIKEHASLTLAAQSIAPNWKVAITGILGACKGVYKSSRGYRWAYA